MCDHPFHSELGVEAASFRQGGLRLVHLAFERISGSQICVREEGAITDVGRVVVLVDSGVEITYQAAEEVTACGQDGEQAWNFSRGRGSPAEIGLGF